jgi:hypothetical protein
MSDPMQIECTAKSHCIDLRAGAMALKNGAKFLDFDKELIVAKKFYTSLELSRVKRGVNFNNLLKRIKE